MWVQEIEYLEKGKTKVYLSSGEIWMLYRSEIRQFDLQEETELTDEVYDRIREEVLLKRVKKRALYLLEKMDRTEQGLRKKLSEQEYPSDLIDAAIAYVKSFHYIDDKRYAGAYVRCRAEKKSKGKLRMELIHKGIPKSIADEVLEEELSGRDEEGLITELLRKRNYDSDHATIQEKRRMYGYLLRRGFGSNDICKALNCQ